MPDYIFESGWEVCNKVGGIYTVLSTRAKTLQQLFPDKIIFIGPDLWKGTDNQDFIEDNTLSGFAEWKRYAGEKDNLNVRTGRWNISGQPIVVLVDFQSCYEIKNDLYFEMWKKFGVDSIGAFGDYDESCMFAYATGLVVESLYNYLQLSDKKVIAHLNEWMMGMAVLYLQDRVPAIATVFTTHATSIGRSICGNNLPLYDQLANYNGDRMARELNMEAKHSLEKQTARHVDCFTTVSELTANECRHLLEKQPDIVTPNGFDSHIVSVGEESEAKRKVAREILIRTASQLTGDFIPDDAFLVATSGRYEYKNKGIDVFIEAISRIRWANPPKPVVAFILVPAQTNGVRTDLQNRLQNKETATEPLPDPYYTHDLSYPEEDKICRYLQYLNFTNQQSQPVKILFVPSYLHENDGIFNLTYYDLLTGMDLTVFPSYYEPWGYTPLESIAFGIPTITSNLAGFGLWAKEEGVKGDDRMQEVKVLERTDTNYFDTAEAIKDSIISYSGLSPEQVRSIHKAAQSLSHKAAWSRFIEYYLKAYTIAFENQQKRILKPACKNCTQEHEPVAGSR
jgi:glycosyltransferase involved in cell wall biosynthesis